MWMTCEVPLGPLAIDGSHYASWSIHVRKEIRTMAPFAEKVVVASF
jgi:hypothetical protein